MVPQPPLRWHVYNILMSHPSKGSTTPEQHRLDTKNQCLCFLETLLTKVLGRRDGSDGGQFLGPAARWFSPLLALTML